MAVKHYLDEIPPIDGRTYQIITTGNTSKINDVTAYQQEGSGFSATDVNCTCILECNYEKVGTTHQLTTENIISENIKFFATEDFNSGDSFTFNGKEVIAKTIDGHNLNANFFKKDSIVFCHRKDNTLYFSNFGDGILDIIKLHLDFNANAESDFNYSVNTDGTITITGYIGTETDVVIPHIINSKLVTKIGERAFYENYNVSSIFVPNTVKEICTYAFGHSSISSVVIEDNSKLQRIENYAFTLSQITEITLPKSLECIEKGAFCICRNLAIVIAPDTTKLTSFGAEGSATERVFESCADTLTLYQGEDQSGCFALYNEAMHSGFGIRRFVCNKLMSDLLYDIMMCSNASEIPNIVLSYITMEGLV